MDEEKLNIRLEQIQNGVRLTENYSRRFTECLLKEDMSGSVGILQGLISVIGEMNRAYLFDTLYQMFNCSLKTLKTYLFMLVEADRRFRVLLLLLLGEEPEGADKAARR